MPSPARDGHVPASPATTAPATRGVAASEAADARSTPARSLVGRVARTTALAAGLGAAAAAAGSGVLAYHLVAAREDGRLRDAALTLVHEMEPDTDDAAAGRRADDEAHEIAHTGVRIAVHAGSTRLGGGPGTPPPGALGCDDTEEAGAPLRRCTVTAGRRTVTVASSLAPLVASREQLALAAFAGALLAAVGGALVSRRVAAHVVGPLARLRAAVAAVPAVAPHRAALTPAEGYEEVDALRAAIAAMLARLDAALAQATRFAADAAHELRTPLAAVRAEVELLAEEPGTPAGTQEGLARVRRQVTALGALVERLLILAMPGDDAAVGGEAVAMAEIARDAVAALPPERGARVSVDADDEGLVRGDATLLRAAIDNALDNALKFDAAAGPVAVRVAAAGAEIVTTVHDSGPGIAEAERKHVFEAFYRAPAARAAAPGHGIGLALVAHVATGHGGSVRFVDVTDGACLELTLPRWRTA